MHSLVEPGLWYVCMPSVITVATGSLLHLPARDYHRAVETLFPQELDATATVQPIRNYADQELSAKISTFVTCADKGLIMLTQKRAEGTFEQEFSHIGFVKNAQMSPLADREYLSC